MINIIGDYYTHEVQISLEYMYSKNTIVSFYGLEDKDISNIANFILQSRLFELELILVADRNIVNAISRLSIDPDKDKDSHILAAHICAFCSYFDIIIDPTMSYYEYIVKNDKSSFMKEFAAFLSSYNTPCLEMLDFIHGRSSEISCPNVPVTQDVDPPASLPLRYYKNYVVALKIAIIKNQRSNPRKKVLDLLEWMVSDYFLAGGAMAYAIVYFSNIYSNKGMIKNIDSDSDQVCLEGIKNAAWDMTYLSEMLTRMNISSDGNSRLLFCSNDKNLIAAAKFLRSTMHVISDDDHIAKNMEESLLLYYTKKDAIYIISKLRYAQSKCNVPNSERPLYDDSRTQKKILELENQLKTSRNTSKANNTNR